MMIQGSASDAKLTKVDILETPVEVLKDSRDRDYCGRSPTRCAAEMEMGGRKGKNKSETGRLNEFLGLQQVTVSVASSAQLARNVHVRYNSRQFSLRITVQ
jgi:hypothetical protein